MSSYILNCCFLCGLIPRNPTTFSKFWFFGLDDSWGRWNSGWVVLLGSSVGMEPSFCPTENCSTVAYFHDQKWETPGKWRLRRDWRQEAFVPHSHVQTFLSTYRSAKVKFRFARPTKYAIQTPCHFIHVYPIYFIVPLPFREPNMQLFWPAAHFRWRVFEVKLHSFRRPSLKLVANAHEKSTRINQMRNVLKRFPEWCSLVLVSPHDHKEIGYFLCSSGSATLPSRFNLRASI